MYNKFVDNVNSDETNDLGWLDSWAMELEQTQTWNSFRDKNGKYTISSKIVTLPVIACLPIACDLLGNAPLCPIREGLEPIQTPTKRVPSSHWNDKTEPKVVSSTRLSREAIVGDWGMEIENEYPIHDCNSPDAELRRELFVAMLESGCMVLAENFDRIMALDCPLDFADESVCFASETTEVHNDNPLLGNVGYHKLTERKFLSVRELSKMDMKKNKEYCESQNR